MREYVVVPAGMLGKPDVLARWVKKAFDHAASLPEKKPRGKGRAGAKGRRSA